MKTPKGPLPELAVLFDDETAVTNLAKHFRSIEDFEQRASHAIRSAIDDVIDGPRTGRWSLTQLDTPEKAYIGLRVEHALRDEFHFVPGKRMDNTIKGLEVDTKFSLRGTWMIPDEAVGQICLLVAASDKNATFKVGLVRAALNYLNPGRNKDRKRTLSKAGRDAISWIVTSGKLERNFLAELEPAVRETILNTPKGQPRVTELFRRVQDRIIPRYVIALLAQQYDPMKRARDARKALKTENIAVLNGRYQSKRMAQHGFLDAGPTDWLSIRER